MIESLPRDGHVLLESMDEPEVYVQVWLRPEGHYQLEVRDGSLQLSLGWLDEHSGDGDDHWRDGFQWDNISCSL
ncbi:MULTISPECIES: hypothetical protein [unclassified Knoellia]|uniref:hypothetical protein n=1 Tax=Knoellia altitudinis TaxID=3404795 RepID=UPI00360A36BD